MRRRRKAPKSATTATTTSAMAAIRSARAKPVHERRHVRAAVRRRRVAGGRAMRRRQPRQLRRLQLEHGCMTRTRLHVHRDPPTRCHRRCRVTIVYRDFIGYDQPGGFVDFENKLGDERGLLETRRSSATLGADGKPAADEGEPFDRQQRRDRTPSEYRDEPGTNLTYPMTLDLTQQGSGSDSYQFYNTAFFPLDATGWPAQGNRAAARLAATTSASRPNAALLVHLWGGGEKLTFAATTTSGCSSTASWRSTSAACTAPRPARSTLDADDRRQARHDRRRHVRGRRVLEAERPHDAVELSAHVDRLQRAAQRVHVDDAATASRRRTRSATTATTTAAEFVHRRLLWASARAAATASFSAIRRAVRRRHQHRRLQPLQSELHARPALRQRHRPGASGEQCDNGSANGGSADASCRRHHDRIVHFAAQALRTADETGGQPHLCNVGVVGISGVRRGISRHVRRNRACPWQYSRSPARTRLRRRSP